MLKVAQEKLSVGLLFQILFPEGQKVNESELWTETKERAIVDIKEHSQNPQDRPFYVIEMPCGGKTALAEQDIRDLPMEPIPCFCGNPNHSLVRCEFGEVRLKEEPDVRT